MAQSVIYYPTRNSILTIEQNFGTHPVMNEQEKKKLVTYFDSIKNFNAEQLMASVESYLDDEDIETFVDHLEEFYGIQDDEELGMLAQIMISGFVAAKKISN